MEQTEVTDPKQPAKPEDKKPETKWKRYAVLAGAVLALICHSVPTEYRAICNAIAQICRGGF